MSLYEKVMLLCQQNGITKTKLERDCGFSQNSINKWVSQSPSTDKILKIADYFNVSVDYLLGKTDNPTPPNADAPETSELVIPEKYKDVAVAFHGGVDNLTQEDIDDIVRFIEFIKNKKK